MDGMPPARLGTATRAWLLAAAREALAEALGVEAARGLAPPDDPALSEPTRVFVSWHEGERLVGCIGTLEAERPLAEAVRYYAVQAGLFDPRTPNPVAADLPRLTCEISVLGPPTPMSERGLPAITAALVPGRDGLVLRDGDRRAVFLPVVWNMLPTPHEFVAALCRKARIDATRRAHVVTGERFFAERFDDHG